MVTPRPTHPTLKSEEPTVDDARKLVSSERHKRAVFGRHRHRQTSVTRSGAPRTPSPLRWVAFAISHETRQRTGGWPGHRLSVRPYASSSAASSECFGSRWWICRYSRARSMASSFRWSSFKVDCVPPGGVEARVFLEAVGQVRGAAGKASSLGCSVRSATLAAAM